MTPEKSLSALDVAPGSTTTGIPQEKGKVARLSQFELPEGRCEKKTNDVQASRETR
jgi:hypothetical protein